MVVMSGSHIVPKRRSVFTASLALQTRLHGSAPVSGEYDGRPQGVQAVKLRIVTPECKWRGFPVVDAYM